MRELPIKNRILPCPVCQKRSLVGYSFDLPETEFEYTMHFLPRPMDKPGEDGEYLIDNITLFNNFFCPDDLYVYTGNVVLQDNEHQFDENIFYEIRRYLRPDQSEFMGLRISFLVNALLFNGLDPQAMIPDKESHPEALLVAKLVSALLESCKPKAFDARMVSKIFRKLSEEMNWNPFEKILNDFYGNSTFMISILELQLADTIYMLHRSLEKGFRPFGYDSLYPRLENLQATFRRQTALNTDLVSDILFQCLKLSEFMHDGRGMTLLQTAYEASDYLKTVHLRIGADLNRKMHVLSRNVDVLFFLNIQLGRELDLDNENAKDLFQFLLKRLDTHSEYRYPKNDKESVRTMRIGKQLQEHCEILKAGMAD